MTTYTIKKRNNGSWVVLNHNGALEYVTDSKADAKAWIG